MKIFGKELAGSSIWVEKGGSSGGSGSGDVGSVEVQAFLMKAGIGGYKLMVDRIDIDLIDCGE